MTEKQKTIVKKKTKAEKAYLTRKNKHITELSMPIVEAAFKTNSKGEIYWDEELFLLLLQRIADNVLCGHQITITAKELVS